MNKNTSKFQKWYAKNKEYYKCKRRAYWVSYRKIVLKRQEELAGRKRPARCEVCSNKGRICFDHDHSTGKFRGWLCNNCNMALGCIKDNANVLKQLVQYLESQTT